MTAGDLARQGGQDQPLTEHEHPGGDSIVAHQEHDPAAAEGPFTTRQLLRLDHALRIANTETGLTFSVFIGEFETPARAYAESLHKQIDGAERAVLVAISPNQRKLEIVTGSEARKRISDRDAKLAGLSMAAAFAGGDLAGGVVAGIDQLASHAGRA